MLCVLVYVCDVNVGCECAADARCSRVIDTQLARHSTQLRHVIRGAGTLVVALAPAQFQTSYIEKKTNGLIFHPSGRERCAKSAVRIGSIYIS